MTIGAVNLILLCAYLIHFDTILPPSSSVPHIGNYYNIYMHLEIIILITQLLNYVF